MSATGYISSIAPAAQQAVSGSGLFASVMIAQAAEESGFGGSPLASKYNNHFGIKATSKWDGGTVKMDTTEYASNKPYKVKADFRTYNTLSEGFADRVKFLEGNSRYRKNGVFSAPTPEAQAQALQKAGYATDPQYASKLINIINRYNLKQYDSGIAPAAPEKAPAKTANSIAKKIITITGGMVIAVLVGLIIFNIIVE